MNMDSTMACPSRLLGCLLQPANCTKTVFELLKGRPDASAFLEAANKTGPTCY